MLKLLSLKCFDFVIYCIISVKKELFLSCWKCGGRNVFENFSSFGLIPEIFLGNHEGEIAEVFYKKES